MARFQFRIESKIKIANVNNILPKINKKKLQNTLIPKKNLELK